MKESAGEGGDERRRKRGGSSPFPSDCLSSSTHPGVRVGVTLLWTCRRSVHTLLSLGLFLNLCHYFLDFSGFKKGSCDPPPPHLSRYHSGGKKLQVGLHLFFLCLL